MLLDSRIRNDVEPTAEKPYGSTMQSCDPVFDDVTLSRLKEILDAADLRELMAGIPAEATRAVNLIKAAVEVEDLTAVREAAHALAGLAGNFGAVRLAAIARLIERPSSEIRAVTDWIVPLELALEETSIQIALIA